MARADRRAAAAGDAFLIVDDREIPHNMDGIKITLAFTQVAADAANVTNLTRDRAALVVGAGDDDVCVIRYRNDDLAWADLHALHAARAFVRVHTGHAVHNVDCVEFADRNAGAEAETAGRASRRAVAGHKHR